MHQVKRFKNQVGICMILKSHWSLLLTQLTKKGNKKNMWWRKPTPLLFHKKIFTQSTKQINHKHLKYQSLPPKNINQKR